MKNNEWKKKRFWGVFRCITFVMTEYVAYKYMCVFASISVCCACMRMYVSIWMSVHMCMCANEFSCVIYRVIGVRLLFWRWATCANRCPQIRWNAFVRSLRWKCKYICQHFLIVTVEFTWIESPCIYIECYYIFIYMCVYFSYQLLGIFFPMNRIFI